MKQRKSGWSDVNYIGSTTNVERPCRMIGDFLTEINTFESGIDLDKDDSNEMLYKINAVRATTLINQYQVNVKVETPNDYRDIPNTGEYAEEWRKGCDEEIASLEKNKSYVITDLPPGRKAIKTRWTFRAKRDAQNNISRFKARWVTKGYTQVEGVDFTETYAPVISIIALRMLMCLVVVMDWDITQMDVETAFLNAELTEEIYVELPEGYYHKERAQRKVLRMLKAIYGLRQAPFEWNKLINSVLIECGLRRSELDECLYIAKNGEGKLFIMTVYVDDLIITGDWEEMITKVRGVLEKRFKMKDVTDSNQIIGLVYEHDKVKGIMKIHQRNFIETILEKFDPGGQQQCDSPADVDTYKEIEELIENGKVTVNTEFPYRSLVGCLQYLTVMTRPDIGNIVRYLSRFLATPNNSVIGFAMRVVYYLRNTVDVGLLYKKSENELDNNKLVAYSDASYACDYFTGRSTTGNLIMMNGGPIMWKSEMLGFVVMSSTHSEYAAMSTSVFQIKYASSLLSDMLGLNRKTVIVNLQNTEQAKVAMETVNSYSKEDFGIELRVDNAAALFIANNESSASKRAKHINVRFMNVREAVKNRDVKLSWISTVKQIADILTKCLNKTTFLNLRKMILSR
jgi:hypothetical protein